MSDNRHIVDVINMHLHVAALSWYNICIVLQICFNYSDVIRLKAKVIQ